MDQRLHSDADEAAHLLIQRELAARFPGREPTPEEFNALLAQLVTASCDPGGSGELIAAEVRALLVKMRRAPDASA